ncbi:MAG: nickel-dependent lactate racemase [Deltaproteobacteria bacterium]|nr:nickel-dependent lactate racemase [Deltaproteobacteria bacterium]
MMEIKIPYGHGSETIDCPEEHLVGVRFPNEVPKRDEHTILQEAITNPIGAGPLEDFLADSPEVLFVVNDATRPTPTARILDHLAGEIEGGRPVHFLVATGAHTPPTPAECKMIFGPMFERFQKVISIHDAQAESKMVHLGITPRGTPLALSRRVVEAPKIVAISSVEPHYFAGYTGGRKSFFPGAAAFSTIEHNHRLALEEGASPLVLEGNPVHEDLAEAMGALEEKEIYSFQVVLDQFHRICAASAGSLEGTFAAAMQKAREVFSVKVHERADIVVTVAHAPMDIDLYQSHKAIEHGRLILKEGGIIILVSQCPKGVGNKGFYRLLCRAADPEEVFKLIEKSYCLGDHKAAKIADLAMRAQMWGVTDLDPKILEQAFIRPYPDLQGALSAAIKEKGPHARVVFLMNGTITVPTIGGDS